MESSAGQNTPAADGLMAPKISTWKNEPEVRALKQDLEASRPAHDAFALNVDRWNDLSQVKGRAKPEKVKGRSSVEPKLIRRQAEWRYSALTEPFNSSDKLFNVSPANAQSVEAARQNETVLNWQFRTKLNRVSFIDHYVRANVDEGSAIIRLGWCRTMGQEEQDAPVWQYAEPSTAQHIQEFDAGNVLRQTNPDQFEQTAPDHIKEALTYADENGGRPVVASQIGTQKVPVDKVLDNRPTLEVLDPRNVYIDPSCGYEFDKAGFVVVAFETSQADLKKEPKRYKNLKYVNWEGASVNAEPYYHQRSTDTNFNYTDSLRKKVVAYEYWGLWDIHGKGELVPIVATWIGNTLIRMEENPFPDGKPPFVVVNYMPKKRELLGEPDAELLEDNQKIHGAITRGMIDLLGRSANGQQGFAKGMLDPVNRRRYEDGKDYEFNPNLPPQQGLIEHKYPEIPQSAITILQLQNQEAEALTGVKSFSGGISGEAYGDVAAGIKGVLDAAAKREMAILRRLANGIVEIGRKLIKMNSVFLSDQEVIEVTKEEFVTINREDLIGEFDLKVDISTAEVDNNKAQDLAFMLQTIGPNSDWGFQQIILSEIARLKRMPQLEMAIKTYQPKPDPVQQQLAQLQLQKLQMEIQELQSRTELNHSRSMQAAHSADQTNLDTIEQETGVEHARAMELAAAQAGGNQDLEVTKALVKPRKQANGQESKPDIEAAAGWNNLTKMQRDPRNNQ